MFSLKQQDAGACVENTCTSKSAAQWTALGCTPTTVTGTTVTGLGQVNPATNYGSCTVTCPDYGAAFVVDNTCATTAFRDDYCGQTCSACTSPIVGAATGATYRCISAGATRFASGGCAASATVKKTVGIDESQYVRYGTMTTCTAACAGGSWDNNNVCTACTAVANAATGATVTCTSASDSRVSACATNAFKTAGAAGATDVCTTCTTVVGKAAGTDGAITCTSASDSRVANCIAGKFKTVGATGAIDVCTTCTAVTNFATVTCSTDANSVATSCDSGFWLVSSYFFPHFFGRQKYW